MPKGTLKSPRTVNCKVCGTPFSTMRPGGRICDRKECREDRSRQYFRDYKKRPYVRAKHRNGYLLEKYGISSEEYARLLAAQGGVCGICKRTSPDAGEQKWFHVDHVEASGESLVRGILCNRCNSGIGMFQHDPELMKTAIKYLMDHEEVQGER